MACGAAVRRRAAAAIRSRSSDRGLAAEGEHQDPLRVGARARSARATASTSVVVLPVPGPASTSSGPARWSTTARCARVQNRGRRGGRRVAHQPVRAGRRGRCAWGGWTGRRKSRGSPVRLRAGVCGRTACGRPRRYGGGVPDPAVRVPTLRHRGRPGRSGRAPPGRGRAPPGRPERAAGVHARGPGWRKLAGIVRASRTSVRPAPSQRARVMSSRGRWPSAARPAVRSGVPSAR